MEDKLLALSGKKNETIIKILRKLSEEDRNYSLDYLSTYINASIRTVQRYVATLEAYIEDYRKEKRSEFKLFQTRKGIRLSINETANIDFLISYLLQKNQNIHLLMSLLLQEYSSEIEYSTDNFVRLHRVNESLDRMNHFFNEFNLVIDKRKFVIVGSEVTIRFLIHNIFWLIHRCDNFPSKFEILEIEKLKKDIDYLTESLNISMDNPVDEKDLIFRFSISLLRYQKKCFVHLETEQKNNIPIYQNQLGYPTLYEATETILNKYNVYDPEEVYFLVLSFLSNKLMYTSRILKNQLLSHHKKNNTKVLKATNLFLDRFQEKICVIPQKKMTESFEFLFISHFIASIDINQFDDYNSYLFDEIRQQSPEYIYILDNIIDNLRKKEQLVLFNKKKYLFNRYMMLNYFLELKLFYKKTINIKLYSDFPDLYEDFIKDYLITRFKNDYKLSFIDNGTDQAYDLILTSCLMNEIPDRTIFISYPLKSREVTALTRKFDELSK